MARDNNNHRGHHGEQLPRHVSLLDNPHQPEDRLVRVTTCVRHHNAQFNKRKARQLEHHRLGQQIEERLMVQLAPQIVRLVLPQSDPQPLDLLQASTGLDQPNNQPRLV